MKILLAAATLAIPVLASAQDFDFSAVLTGTETAEGWNATSDTPTFTTTSLSEVLDVTLTPQSEFQGGGIATLYINDSPLGVVDPIALPTSGDAFAVNYTSPYGPSMGTVTVSTTGAVALTWGGQTYTEALAGSGTFTDPPTGGAVAAPELSGGMGAGLTLAIGLGLVLCPRKRLSGTHS